MQLIFDLDGTLSDPLLGITRCMQHALNRLNLPGVTEAQVKELVGPPLDLSFAQITGKPQDEPIVLELVSIYRDRYGTLGCLENQLYPQITDTLQTLKSSGIAMGVCTSKRKDFAEKILAHFELLSFMDFIDGGDIGVTKGQQLARLLTQGVVGDQSIMIGDRHVDIEAAHQNGLRAIGVLWGYGSQEELAQAGADLIISKPSDLLGAWEHL